MKLSELEVKLKILSEDHFQKILNTCIHLFGEPISHVLQKDEYFDTPDGQLKKQDLVIRIRTINEKKIIALKSPRINLPSGMTDRIELEFLSDDKENIDDSLHKQGLKSFETIEKKRWSLIFKNCEIVLDQLPFIGLFIEIEGPSESSIQEMVQLLSLSSCPVILKNYSELMLEKFHDLNLSTTSMCATFAYENELKSYQLLNDKAYI